MLVTIDKRGSISLPSSLRKDFGYRPGTHLELTVAPGGAITLYPVEIYRSVKLSETGLDKLHEARTSGDATFPVWFDQELANARLDSE